ncbi:MAG: CPBP family intramembrane glutamic endopeptidase [Thermoproteota archaeon]|nr:CPBP family intramembrane glutamic endopeptidase [Thermoproteota archaeon]
MSLLENILHGVGIPFSALTSVIFGLMIVSFPLGAYAIFNSDIGNDIDYNFPLQKFDMFIAGVNIQLPLEYEIGDIFVIAWSTFIILFVISFLGPKKNFFKTIGDILSNGKNSFSENTMINIIKWFSILVLISAIITIIQESFGIVTEPPDTENDLILFLQISLAPITEEIGFRLVLIGIPLFLIYSHKSSMKFFFKSLWNPYSNLHIYENRKAIALIIGVGIFFGIAHVISGEPWTSGKILQASIGGIIIGWVYFRYGLAAAIMLHWATNYFIYSYLFLISEINGISVQNATSHSMIGTFEIILIFSGIISSTILLLNYKNSKKPIIQE